MNFNKDEYYKSIDEFVKTHKHYRKCEWCHGFDVIGSNRFYHVKLFGLYDHYICKDCYKHLKIYKREIVE